MWWRHVRSDPLAHAIIWGVLRAKQPLSILFSFLSPFFLYFERACFFNRNLPNKILYIETNKGGGGGVNCLYNTSRFAGSASSLALAGAKQIRLPKRRPTMQGLVAQAQQLDGAASSPGPGLPGCDP
jgi:hypothetical protein